MRVHVASAHEKHACLHNVAGKCTARCLRSHIPDDPKDIARWLRSRIDAQELTGVRYRATKRIRYGWFVHQHAVVRQGWVLVSRERTEVECIEFSWARLTIATIHNCFMCGVLIFMCARDANTEHDQRRQG